jgi:hypothetical protein
MHTSILYTPDTLNTGMCIKSRGWTQIITVVVVVVVVDTIIEGASLIFPNVERNRRGRKSPFNDRCTEIVNSLRSAAVHRGRFTASILNYAWRGSAYYYCLCGIHAETQTFLSVRRAAALSPRERLQPRCDRTPPSPLLYTLRLLPSRSTDTRARVHACDTGLNCLRRLVIEWLTAGLCRAGECYARAEKPRGEKCAGRGTGIRFVSPFGANAYR